MEGCAATSQGALQFEVALVDVSAEREDKTQGALCLCSQVAQKEGGQPPEILWTGGTEGAREKKSR